MNKAIVAGVDMVKFVKPGQQKPYRVMATEAIQGAVKEAGIDYSLIEQAYAGYVYGDSTCGEYAMYGAFNTGIPVINVNNNCSTGSTALYLARQAVQSGAVECALAFGFEEMVPGALGFMFEDRETPFEDFTRELDTLGVEKGPLALRQFGAAGAHYLEKYDASADLFAKVSVKTRNHAIVNPYSMFTNPLSVEEVMAAPVVFGDYLTRLMCCPPTCGAAAAIVVSEAFAKKHGISNGVEIIGQAMATDTDASYEDPINMAGADMTARATAQVVEASGVGIDEVDVVELHDCFTVNEVISYEGLGLCGKGESTKFVDDGDTTYGGKFVVNPSGGLMSKGHPIGATGLAQCFELVNQMRGNAGQRQVPNAKIALQHNLGLGGAVVVTMYRKHQ